MILKVPVVTCCLTLQNNSSFSATPESRLCNIRIYFFFFLQCISPGVVETEFGKRLYSNNADKAAKVYTRFKVTLLIVYPKNSCNYYKCLLITNLTHCLHLLQPLEATDVANTVIYALSSPPHMQVCGFFKHKCFCSV